MVFAEQGSQSITENSGLQDQEGFLSVGLAVVQSFDRTRKVPRAAISMSAVETCLKEVCQAAVSSCGKLPFPCCCKVDIER